MKPGRFKVRHETIGIFTMHVQREKGKFVYGTMLTHCPDFNFYKGDYIKIQRSLSKFKRLRAQNEQS